MTVTKIQPTKMIGLDFKELWHFRGLFYFLTLRDIKVRYKQTAIGILWAILQPFLTMVVFSIFFGRMTGIYTKDIPYPIFVYTGLLFWNYFAQSLVTASDRLVNEQGLIQKVYFPRLIMPLSATVVYFIDFIFASMIFVGLMFYYSITPNPIGILLVIPCLLITFLTASGLGLFLSAVNVRYRDIRYALPFFIQLLIFVTPIIYSADVLGEYKWFWYFNPIAGVVGTMRSGLLRVDSIDWSLFSSSALLAVLIFIFGLLYFKKSENNFADIV